ncbi:MAG: type I 3-dehydroquinate dehydratase, partial [Nanoarchaeota archaeon]|nr:type I 3-dehydroquinate dehydratase [Nanoarchaeota archaeon]
MITVPIIATTVNQARLQAGKINHLVELRLDHIKALDEKKLVQLVGIVKKKIITIRRKDEGGHFKGSEKKRVQLIKKAIDLGAEYVDIELRTVGIEDIIKNKGKTKIIVSFHNFKKTDNREIGEVYNKINKLNSDIIKIVTYANSIDDNLDIFNLIKKAVKDKKKIVAVCMGEKGEISRILAPRLGAYMTFACIDGKESAPGQMSLDNMINLYRVNRLNSKTKIYGLVGNPVSKSKGIIIHNKAFAKDR